MFDRYLSNHVNQRISFKGPIIHCETDGYMTDLNPKTGVKMLILTTEG